MRVDEVDASELARLGHGLTELEGAGTVMGGHRHSKRDARGKDRDHSEHACLALSRSG